MKSDQFKYKPILLRLTVPTHAQLSKMATDNGTTVSAVIRFILDRGLKSIRESK